MSESELCESTVLQFQKSLNEYPWSDTRLQYGAQARRVCDMHTLVDLINPFRVLGAGARRLDHPVPVYFFAVDFCAL